MRRAQICLIDGRSLDIETLERVARGACEVGVAAGVAERVEAGRQIVERAAAAQAPVYGLNTGVGVLKRVSQDGSAEFQHRLLATHDLAQGRLYADAVVRAGLIRLANEIASGAVGVRFELLSTILTALNDNSLPAVHMEGGYVLVGAGLARGLLDGSELQVGEGLAMMTGLSLPDGHLGLVVREIMRVADAMEVAGALSFEAFQAQLAVLDADSAALKRSEGLCASAKRLRRILNESELWDPEAARNLQDPISFRETPYTLGGLRECLTYVVERVNRQLNSCSRNPAVLLDAERLIHTGHWSVRPMLCVIDYLRSALAAAVVGSQERSMKLLDRFWSGLPTGLTAESAGADNGLSMCQMLVSWYAAKALRHAQPTAYRLTSTSQAEGIEDDDADPVGAAQTLEALCQAAEKVVAIELLVSARAIELRGAAARSPATLGYAELIRASAPAATDGPARPLDLEPLVELIRSDGFADRER